MLKFKLSYDDAGRPVHVSTDDGFCQASRPFNSEEDGWMEDQLNKANFPFIAVGKQMEALVNEVNALRRENFHLRKANEQWMRAGGFGREAPSVYANHDTFDLENSYK